MTPFSSTFILGLGFLIKSSPFNEFHIFFQFIFHNNLILPSSSCLLPSATKLRRLCFYTCLSFCSWGVYLSACWYTTPSRSRHPNPPGSRHPLGVDTPLGEGTPRAVTPTGAGTPTGSRHPPGSRHTLPAVGYCCRQHTSYWNALLLYILLAAFGLYWADNCKEKHATGQHTDVLWEDVGFDNVKNLSWCWT